MENKRNIWKYMKTHEDIITYNRNIQKHIRRFAAKAGFRLPPVRNQLPQISLQRAVPQWISVSFWRLFSQGGYPSDLLEDHWHPWRPQGVFLEAFWVPPGSTLGTFGGLWGTLGAPLGVFFDPRGSPKREKLAPCAEEGVYSRPSGKNDHHEQLNVTKT